MRTQTGEVSSGQLSLGLAEEGSVSWHLFSFLEGEREEAREHLRTAALVVISVYAETRWHLLSQFLFFGSWYSSPLSCSAQHRLLCHLKISLGCVSVGESWYVRDGFSSMESVN